MVQHRPIDHAQDPRRSNGLAAIGCRLPPMPIPNRRWLGLRRLIPVLILAWLLLLLVSDRLYPIDVRGWFISGLLILAYLLPTFLAFDRGHRRSVVIGVLNVLLGWTIIGWVGLLLWSLTQAQRTPQAVQRPETGASDASG